VIAYPQIDPVLISFGPFAVRWYGLMYLLGICLGYVLVKKDLYQRLNFDFDQILNNATYLVLGIIFGGRLGYILFYDLPFYLKNPLEIIAVWHGGMSYHGAAIGCLLALVLYGWLHKKKLLIMLDLLGFASTIGLGLGRIGNFINGELYGRVTDVPWAMVFPYSDHLPRHPSQLYEAFLEGLVLFLILLFLKKRANLKNGQLFGAYLFFYGSFRFCLEFFRQPDAQVGLFINYFSMGQILCLIMIVAGLSLFIYRQHKPENLGGKS
jgi:phosphatidylglycerol:prolipoprotein diacylglycerol transferase